MYSLVLYTTLTESSDQSVFLPLYVKKINKTNSVFPSPINIINTVFTDPSAKSYLNKLILNNIMSTNSGNPILTESKVKEKFTHDFYTKLLSFSY